MNRMSMTDFRRIAVDRLPTSMPVEVLIDGEPTYVVGTPGQILIIGDLHPRVQNMLRALHDRARVGMPPPATVTVKISPEGD